MKKLLLFDIDRTLLVGRHDNRFNRAINEVHDLGIQSDKDFQGYTDYLILAILLKDEGWEDEQIKAAMPELLKALDKVHADSFDATTIKLMPGVQPLLAALAKTDTTLGLITGNVKSIAERKLQAVNIWQYFSVGGCGDDPHQARSDLVKLAVQRAGFADHLEEVYVIGDTPRDIQAAAEAGVTNSVGVTNGFCSPQELRDAGAAIVLEDFTDTNAVLAKFGLTAL